MLEANDTAVADLCHQMYPTGLNKTCPSDKHKKLYLVHLY